MKRKKSKRPTLIIEIIRSNAFNRSSRREDVMSFLHGQGKFELNMLIPWILVSRTRIGLLQERLKRPWLEIRALSTPWRNDRELVTQGRKGPFEALNNETY